VFAGVRPGDSFIASTSIKDLAADLEENLSQAMDSTVRLPLPYNHPLLRLTWACAQQEAWSQQYADEGGDDAAAEMAKKSALLRSVSIFADCDDSFVERLASKLETRSYKQGVHVVAKGEAGGSMYFVKSGTVEILPELSEPSLKSLGVGSYFGEASLMTKEPTNAFVMAAEELECYVLREPDLAQALKRDPDVAGKIEAQMHRRDAEREQHRVSIGSLLAAATLSGQENFEVKWREGRPSRSTPRSVLLSVGGMGITIFDGAKTMRPLLTVMFAAVDELSCREGKAFVITQTDGAVMSFASSACADILAAADARRETLASTPRRVSASGGGIPEERRGGAEGGGEEAGGKKKGGWKRRMSLSRG